LLFIVNPSASSVTPRARVVIQKALSADHQVELAPTKRRGHATRLAQAAAVQGVDVVVVLGGDGTLNEAANGLAGTSTALETLPGGSTNVFARTLGLSDDPIEATGDLLEALAAGSIRRVGLGSVNRRYFLFHAGLGFDAAVVEQVERRGQLKRWANHPLFVYAALSTWMRHYDRSAPRFAVSFDDGSSVEEGYFAICLNTNPYTYIGSRPFDIAPEATLDRGLVLVTILSMRLTRFAGLAVSALRRNTELRDNASVDYRTDLASFTVTGYAPFPYQVDGDFLGHVSTLRFQHEPEILDLVMPREG
jgi:diacylglycerol kinase family enzyme